MDIGRALRDARQGQGLTLQEISRATKISTRVLDAIERNETDELAGGLFVRSYLRAYASQVGLDPAHIVSVFRAEREVSEPDELHELRVRCASRGSGRARWGAMIMLIAGLALLVCALYFSRPHGSGGTDPAAGAVRPSSFFGG